MTHKKRSDQRRSAARLCRSAGWTLSHPFKSSPIHALVNAQDASDRAQSRIGQFYLASLNHPDRSRRQLRSSPQFRLRHTCQNPQVSRVYLAGVEANYVGNRDTQDSTHPAQDVDLWASRSGLPELNSSAANTGQTGQGSHGHVASRSSKCGGIESSHHPSTHVAANRLLAPMRRHCAALPLDSRVVAIEQHRFRLRTRGQGGSTPEIC